MKDYMKPELEVVIFTTEAVTDELGNLGGGDTSNIL